MNGGAQNLETDHGLNKIDFKGEALAFRETSSGLIISLNSFLDVIFQKEDELRKKFEKESEKRKRLEEELK